MIKTELMEQILKYIMDHLSEDLSIDDVAAIFNYTPVYFSKIFLDHFEIPFGRFVKMLKLRGAATNIYNSNSLKGIREKCGGYATPMSFSKAFRKEFGMSPREFLKSGMQVPDMPHRKMIDGNEITIEYKTLPRQFVDAWNIDQYTLLPEPEISWAGESAYAFYYDKGRKYWEKCEPKVGLWWDDMSKSIIYSIGTLVSGEEELPEDMVRFDMKGGEYVIFSMKRKADDKESAVAFRQMVRFALCEFKIMNRKTYDVMNFTFEQYDKDHMHLYVPLASTFKLGETIQIYGVDTWPDYIDKHLEENLTITDLALTFGYSRKSFREVFELHYDITPLDYIRKRRLYLTAQDLDKHTEDTKKILKKYRFKSMKDFSKQFKEEYGMEPDYIEQVNFDVVNLTKYYNEYKDDMKISICTLKDIKIVGKSIVPKVYDENEICNIPAIASYWFLNPFTENPSLDMNNRIAMWDETPNIENNELLYEYVLGSVVAKNYNNTNPDLKEFYLKGGRYAVFESMLEDDTANLPEIYTMLTRCAFHGWCKENIVRYDPKRVVFAWYKNKKLYFHIPVYR